MGSANKYATQRCPGERTAGGIIRWLSAGYSLVRRDKWKRIPKIGAWQYPAGKHLPIWHKYTTEKLVQRVTGRSLTKKPTMKYLKEKFGESYTL